MELVIGKTKNQHYASRKDIARIFCYKDPTRLLKGFRNYADGHPKIFEPYKPYVKNDGMDSVYDILCFAYYFENKDLLEAGTRSISFKEELARLREVY